MKNNIFTEFSTMHDAINDAWRYASGEAEAEAIRRQDKAQREVEAHAGLDVSLIKAGIPLDSPEAIALHELVSAAFQEEGQ